MPSLKEQKHAHFQKCNIYQKKMEMWSGCKMGVHANNWLFLKSQMWVLKPDILSLSAVHPKHPSLPSHHCRRTEIQDIVMREFHNLYRILESHSSNVRCIGSIPLLPSCHQVMALPRTANRYPEKTQTDVVD